MRERRTLGSVRAVPGNRHRYSTRPHSRVHELETRERDLAVLAGEGQVALPTPLLLLHASDLVLARCRRPSPFRPARRPVGGGLRSRRNGGRSGARRVGLAQVVGPPGRGRFHRFHRLHGLHWFHGFHHDPRGYGESIRPLRPKEGFFADPCENIIPGSRLQIMLQNECVSHLCFATEVLGANES